MEQNEQWLLSGDCTKCRKKGYCTKNCKPHENAMRLDLYNTIIHATGADRFIDLLTNS